MAREVLDFPLHAHMPMEGGAPQGWPAVDTRAINILRYARRLAGIDQVHALLGGFHLTGPVDTPSIAPRVAAITRLAADAIVPVHCTGWPAMHGIATTLPDAFIPNSVGTRHELTSAGLTALFAPAGAAGMTR